MMNIIIIGAAELPTQMLDNTILLLQLNQSGYSLSKQEICACGLSLRVTDPCNLQYSLLFSSSGD